MKFECRRCNFTTEMKEMPKRCPYCGEAGTVKKAALAQDLLDEVQVDDDAKAERQAARDARSRKF